MLTPDPQKTGSFTPTKKKGYLKSKGSKIRCAGRGAALLQETILKQRLMPLQLVQSSSSPVFQYENGRLVKTKATFMQTVACVGHLM